MFKKILIIFFVLILIPSFIHAQEAKDYVNWIDDRTETKFIASVLDNDYLTEEMRKTNFTLEMSTKIDNDYIDTIYKESDKNFLKDLNNNKITIEQFENLIEKYTIILFASVRPNDFAITKTNEARIREILFIGNGETKNYSPGEIEYLSVNNENITGSGLKVLPGNKNAIFYLLPKTDAKNIVVELYSSVNNTYRTERFVLKNKNL